MRSAPASSASSASRSPTSCGSPSPSTRTTSRPSTDATRPWRRTRGVVVVRRECRDRSSAAAAESPPGTRARPSSRLARSGRRAARESAPQSVVVGAALDRERTLAGRRKHRLVREPLRDERGRARAAEHPRPRAPPRRTRRPSTLRTRVSTFPRIDRISRSGRSARSCAAAAQAARPDDRTASRSSASEPPSRATRQSRTSSLAVTAPTTTPAASSVGQILERVHGDDRSHRRGAPARARP